MSQTSRPRARTAAAKEAQARRTSRTIAGVGAAPLVGVAGYASYFHIVELSVRYGQSQSIAHMMPIAIDGLMIVAAVAVIADRAARLPKLTFAIGALMTLCANVLSVHQPNPIAYVIAGTPAVALLLSAELLLRLCLPTVHRRRKPATKRATAPARTRTRVKPVPATA